MAAPARPAEWPPGAGGMAQRIREHDWAATPIGLIEGWPERLRVVVELMLANPLVASVAIGPERLILYNDTAARLYGERHPQILGRPLAEAFPESYASVASLYDRAFSGEAVEVPPRLVAVSDAGGEVFEATLLPVRDEGGAVMAVQMTGQEVGERVRVEAALRESQERLKVLVAELQHRTRNLLTIVLSVLGRTERDSGDKASLTTDLRSRYQALARVNSLLSRLHKGERVTFDELIHAELQAMGAVDSDGWGAQVTLDGPPGVRLRSATVQTLALALHELATNASKYGALAQREGRLAIRWRRHRVEGEPRLHVEWSETGITVADLEGAPQGTGFGRELIERALPHQLGAETRYHLAADGVRCTITLPLSSKEGAADG